MIFMIVSISRFYPGYCQWYGFFDLYFYVCCAGALFYFLLCCIPPVNCCRLLCVVDEEILPLHRFLPWFSKEVS